VPSADRDLSIIWSYCYRF